MQGGAGLLNFVGGDGGIHNHGRVRQRSRHGWWWRDVAVWRRRRVDIYSNITDGNVSYTAGRGNETIDASLSGGHGLYVGGLDTAGQNLMMAGAGADTLDAGTGAATLFGGGGADVFDFSLPKVVPQPMSSSPIGALPTTCFW